MAFSVSRGGHAGNNLPGSVAVAQPGVDTADGYRLLGSILVPPSHLDAIRRGGGVIQYLYGERFQAV